MIVQKQEDEQKKPAPFAAKIGEATTYDRIDIKNFGKSVLTKLGWREQEDKSMLEGKFDKKLLPRQSRLGLGAKPLSREEAKKKYGKNYIVPEPDESDMLKMGNLVKIIGGQHEGLFAKVISSAKSLDDQDEYISVELTKSQAVLQIKRKRLEKTTTEQQFEKKREVKQESKEKKPLKWIKEGLVVRIVSKSYQDGKFYNMKVRITSIVDQFEFIGACSDHILTDLREKHLQTVIPSTQGQIMVLRGKLEGELATVMSKDKKRERVTV